MEGKQLTAADILGRTDLKIERADVEEWGGHVCVRELSAGGLMAMQKLREAIASGDISEVDAVAASVALFACDESGKLLFTADDVKGLLEKNYHALEKIVLAGAKLNELDEENEEQAQGN